MDNITNTPVYILGDNHGKYEELFHRLDDYTIRDCLLIHQGDGGEGFLPHKEQIQQFNYLNACFKDRNIEYISVRGNHSAPAYFDGSINLSNFKLLPDYTYKTINGQKFLFVGGAISIDRRIRTLNKSYWADEAFVLKPELIEKCDVLICHSTPFWLGPTNKEPLLAWCDKDLGLWDLCVREREGITKLVELCKPDKAYFGHMHMSQVVKHNIGDYICTGRILNELELFEHR